ncbi:MAG: hypothetical protein JF564_04260 [Sphingomonas sp.]|nr:hypothetical protein [Sphingomonas sp.]
MAGHIVGEIALDDSSTPEPAPENKGKQAHKITKKTAVVGAAIGVGSAAIVAALLYANRSNKS